MKIIKQILELRNSNFKKTIDKRLGEFENLNKKSTNEWFSELCFCILTANSKAQTAINIQNELKAQGFCNCSQALLSRTIKKNKHRFHNNKAKYIVGARCFNDIKKIITDIVKDFDIFEAREWLVKNITGLGYKESSHFLRNVGYFDVAILDRHIINLLFDSGRIKEKPRTLTKKKYIEIEKIMADIGRKVKMNQAELDLYMWYIKTGKVLK